MVRGSGRTKGARSAAPRAERRRQDRRVERKWRARLRRWWRWTGLPYTQAGLNRVVRLMVETHGCCPCHAGPKYNRRKDAPALDFRRDAEEEG